MLYNNSDLICANLLNILVKRNLIYFVESSKPAGGTGTGEGQQSQQSNSQNDNIEHCSAQVLQKNKTKPITLHDIILPHATIPRPPGVPNESSESDPGHKLSSQEWAQNLLKDPFKYLHHKDTAALTRISGGNQVPESVQDQIINKLVKFMQKTKFVPKNQTDLERQVKKSIKLVGIQFGDSQTSAATTGGGHSSNQKQKGQTQQQSEDLDKLTQQIIQKIS